ncbi:MAG: hypothetical protein JWN46_2754 [Acidimicrobiales bacterium]|nr:hypothetical protein [Acidimicrobiales bacterium]
MRRSAVLVTLLAAACSHHGSTAPTFPGSGVATSRLSLGHGVAIALPAGWTVTPIPASRRAGSSCGSDAGYLSFRDRVVARAILPDRTCSVGHRQRAPLNGYHGNYLSAADAAAPRHVTTGALGAGSYTVFDQAYTECTNGCRHTTDEVGLLRLSRPADPARPVLMLTADDGYVPAAHMRDLLAAVG